ncbi:ABC transporter permease [Deinococcus rubellus]|uniref:ABC transporter permease n=1 Tax=Deinococcus rubellus TaxID=1889240 RepID=A0ABY5YEC7_9DEIO|nr:ABC transporter permease [Deinococcus rubellus]UWX63163.1 ABC transporter permease [Deinococcus rubellus]
MSNVLLMARLSLSEALRKKLIVVLLVLTAAFLGFYLYGVLRLEQNLTERAADAGLSAGPRRGLGALPVVYSGVFGMYLVYFLGSLMAVLSTVASVSGDIESGVMQSVIARPVTRAQVVLGRWLGFTGMNVLYVLLVSVALLTGLYLITGYLPPAPAAAVAQILLGIVLITSLTVLGSTLFATLANGIAVFVLYGLGSAGGILKSIGALANSPTMESLGNAANIVMPTNALWLGASYNLQTEGALQLAQVARGANPFASTTPIEPGILIWAAVYTALAVLLAMWRFSRRDL